MTEYDTMSMSLYDLMKVLKLLSIIIINYKVLIVLYKQIRSANTGNKISNWSDVPELLMLFCLTDSQKNKLNL